MTIMTFRCLSKKLALLSLIALLITPVIADARCGSRRNRNRAPRQTYAQAVRQLPAAQKTRYRFRGLCSGNCSVVRSTRPLSQYGVQSALGRNRYYRRSNRVVRPLRRGRRVYRSIARHF